MLPRKYYLNDYFDLFDYPYSREKIYLKTDIYEVNGCYVIEVDLPGIPSGDVHVTYDNGYLTIKVIRNIMNNPGIYIRRERFYGEVRRIFYIGNKIDKDIKANLKDGILRIKFPKEDKNINQGKNITVS